MLAASTQIIAPRFAAKSSKKLVGVDLPCLFVIQNPEKHFQILQRQVADKQNLGPKTCQDPFGSAGVHAPCLKQWAPKIIGFPVLEGDPQQTKSVSDPPVTSSVCTYMMIPGVRRPSIKYIRIARATTATTTPNQTVSGKLRSPLLNNKVLASFAGNREITGNHWRCPWWQLLSLFSISSRAPPTTVPRRQAKFQLWSCAHLAPSIFAEICPGCYRSTAPRCAARQLFDFQASAITSDRLLRTRAEASCCVRKTAMSDLHAEPAYWSGRPWPQPAARKIQETTDSLFFLVNNHRFVQGYCRFRIIWNHFTKFALQENKSGTPAQPADPPIYNNRELRANLNHQQHPSTTFTREAIIGGPCDAPLSPEKLPTSIRTEILNCQDPATGFLWRILRKSMSTNRHLRKKLAAPEIPPEKKKTFHWFWALLASIDGVACDIALEKYVMKHEINITCSVQLRTIISAWSAWIFVSLKTVLTEIKYQTAGPSMNLVHVDPNLIGFKSNSSFKSLPIPSP